MRPFAWVCALGCICAGAEDAASARAVAPSPLIVDYLPAAIYEQDSLTLCVRVENAGSATGEYALEARALDEQAKEVSKAQRTLDVKPGFDAETFSVETAHAARITVRLDSGGTRLAQLGLRLLRETDAWPVTARVRGRVVEAATGDALVWVVPKERAKEDRQLALLRWALGTKEVQSGRALAFAPENWRLNIPGLLPLSAPRADGSVPIVNAVADVLDAYAQDRAAHPALADVVKRVALVLPADDLDLATDPRVYRLAVEALLSRLRVGGVLRTTLYLPFKYGSNDAHRAALWKEIRAAATLYGTRVIEPTDWMSERCWRADPAVSGVYRGTPNDEGRKMAEQALADLLK